MTTNVVVVLSITVNGFVIIETTLDILVTSPVPPLKPGEAQTLSFNRNTQTLKLLIPEGPAS